MNQEMQALIIVTLFTLVGNFIFFGFLKGKLAEKTYNWRIKRNLMLEGVSKEEYIQRMKKITPFILIFLNFLYLLVMLIANNN